VIRDILRIIFYTPRSATIPLLPLSYRAMMRGEELHAFRPDKADLPILGAGLARSVGEARRMRLEHNGDPLVTLRHNKRRQRQRMNGLLRLWRRFQRWLI
jgi:hypothetical protein